MRCVIQVAFAAVALLAVTGVQAQCPASVTLNGASFNPYLLSGSLRNLQEIDDQHTAGASFDFSMSLCSAVQSCGGNFEFITNFYAGTRTCTDAQFDMISSFRVEEGSTIKATYRQTTGPRVANVEVVCGGDSMMALTSPSKNFAVSHDTNGVTTYNFTLQTSFCPSASSSSLGPSSSLLGPSAYKKLKRPALKNAKPHVQASVRGDKAKIVEPRRLDRRAVL